MSEDIDVPIEVCVTQAELLTRAKNKWADACIERDAAMETITRLRAELAASAEALNIASGVFSVRNGIPNSPAAARGDKINANRCADAAKRAREAGR